MSKRVIAVLLSIGLIVSSINVMFISPVWGSQTKKGLPFISNFSAKKDPGVVISGEKKEPGVVLIGENKQPDFEKLKSEKNKEIMMKLPEQDKVLYTGTKKSYSENQTTDLFNYTQQDIGELLKSGYSVEDIFKSDEIGNRILEDPKKLLERKRRDKKDWTEVEKAVENERKQNYLSKMQKKYPDIYDKFVNQNLNEDDMSLIFCNAPACQDTILKILR